MSTRGREGGRKGKREGKTKRKARIAKRKWAEKRKWEERKWEEKKRKGRNPRERASEKRGKEGSEKKRSREKLLWMIVALWMGSDPSTHSDTRAWPPSWYAVMLLVASSTTAERLILPIYKNISTKYMKGKRKGRWGSAKNESSGFGTSGVSWVGEYSWKVVSRPNFGLHAKNYPTQILMRVFLSSSFL